MPPPWRELAEPGWVLRFRYPEADSRGRPTIIERGPAGAPFERVHVLAVDRDEVYFEVRRRDGRTTEEGYRILGESLRDQYPGVTVGALGDRLIAGRAARECTFGWDDQKRTAVFVEADGAMYRIIFRPASPTNLEILDSVTLDA